MVAGKSPDWLPSGFTEKVKYKNGRRIKYYHNASTGVTYHSKKGVLSSITAENSLLGMPKTSNGNENDPPSDSQIDAGLDITDGSPKWLPDGWLSEERTRERGYRRGSTYKVYTDVSSGKKFYSRAAATQYLNTVDRADTANVQTEAIFLKRKLRATHSRVCSVMSGSPILKILIGCLFFQLDKADEPSPNCLSMINTGDSPEEQNDVSFKTLDKANEPSPNCPSMINTGGIPEEEKKGTSFKTLDKVDDPSTHTSPQCLSMIMTNTGSISRKKKDAIFKPVHVETAAADDLPPGWIKEIITKKSGKRTRKDPCYTDPVSGYMFRSKPDALRFIKTNDIGTCAIRPKRRELSDLNLAKNENLSPIPAHQKSPEHEGEVFVGGESNGCTKEPSISEAQILKQTISNNNDTDGVTNGEPTETVQEKSINSRKRKAPNSPSHVSKRHSGSEPKTVSDSALNELSLKAAAKVFIGTEEANASQPSDIELAREIEPPKETVVEPETVSNSALNDLSLKAGARVFIGTEEANASQPSDINPTREIEPPKETEIEPPPTDAENPSNGNPRVVHPEEQNKQESPLLFDFGESWADPLEFALKTLRGDIPIESLAASPGYFNVNLSIPHNNNRMDDCLRPSEVPNIFQNKAAGTSKQEGGIHSFPDNSLFSGLGDIGLPDFDSFNGRPNIDVGKKDNQAKLN